MGAGYSTQDEPMLCKHGVSLVSTIGGPSAYCAKCTAGIQHNPRYYADNHHLGAES